MGNILCVKRRDEKHRINWLFSSPIDCPPGVIGKHFVRKEKRWKILNKLHCVFFWSTFPNVYDRIVFTYFQNDFCDQHDDFRKSPRLKKKKKNDNSWEIGSEYMLNLFFLESFSARKDKSIYCESSHTNCIPFTVDSTPCNHNHLIQTKQPECTHWDPNNCSQNIHTLYH